MVNPDFGGEGVCLYRQRKSGSAVEFQKPRRGICICQKPQRRSVKFTRNNILSDPQPYTDRVIERERDQEFAAALPRGEEHCLVHVKP